jgi:hypothetical protein
MWQHRRLYILQALAAMAVVTLLATAVEAAPKRPAPAAPAATTTPPFRVNLNFPGPRFPAIPANMSRAFFATNPLANEAAREQQILFNMSMQRNKPLLGSFSTGGIGYTPGTNPFWNPLTGGPPSVAQQAYNTSVLGAALSNVPPWAFGANPYLSSGMPYLPYGGGGYGGYGYGGGATLSSGGYGGGYASPYGGGAVDPYGGYVSGSTGPGSPSGATLTSYDINPGAAREQAKRANLATRRRAFDDYLYERLNAPTFEDLREFTQHQALRRSLNEPPSTEIWSGASLNTLLNDVQKLQGITRGDLPDISLDEDVVKRLNLNPTARNIGLLRDGGRLSWPLGLRSLPPSDETRELRSQVGTLLQDGVAQAANGKVDPGLVAELNRDVTRLQRLLVAKANELPEDTYIEARQFLNNLEAAVRVLRRPDAGDYLSGRVGAKGSSVQKLVQYMTERGLQFGPGSPGDEGAYNAVHRALARYDTALRGDELRRSNDAAVRDAAHEPAPRAKNR